jgi:hypothetical protein
LTERQNTISRTITPDFCWGGKSGKRGYTSGLPDQFDYYSLLYGLTATGDREFTKWFVVLNIGFLAILMILFSTICRIPNLTCGKIAEHGTLESEERFQI